MKEALTFTKTLKFLPNDHKNNFNSHTETETNIALNSADYIRVELWILIIYAIRNIKDTENNNKRNENTYQQCKIIITIIYKTLINWSSSK